MEVVSFASLERAWKEADQPFHREHVMPFFYEGTPPDLQVSRGQRAGEQSPPNHASESARTWYVSHGTSLRGFKVAVLNHHPDYGDLRWTVDTSDDLTLLREIFAHFPGRDTFPLAGYPGSLRART